MFEFNPKSKAQFPDTWIISQSAELATLLADHSVGVLDTSARGTQIKAAVPSGTGPGYQVSYAQDIKAAVGDKMLVSAVGGIKNGLLAEEVLHSGIDVVMAGRLFQTNPGLV